MDSQQEELRMKIEALSGQIGQSQISENMCAASREPAKMRLKRIIDRLRGEVEGGTRQANRLQALYNSLPETLDRESDEGLYDVLDLMERGARSNYPR